MSKIIVLIIKIKIRKGNDCWQHVTSKLKPNSLEQLARYIAHIPIQSPGGTDPENFRNRKGCFSLNVQTVSAANLKINDIVARWQGSTHDQRIKKRFKEGEFGHFIHIGDSGYTNTCYLATPFLNVTNADETLFNESQRWFPVFSIGIRYRVKTEQSIIIACAVLHNIAIDENESQPSPEIPRLADVLAAAYVLCATLMRAPSAPNNNIRSRLIRTYVQPMLDR